MGLDRNLIGGISLIFFGILVFLIRPVYQVQDCGFFDLFCKAENAASSSANFTTVIPFFVIMMILIIAGIIMVVRKR